MKKKILIVEDEPSIADNIAYALETEGFESVWRSTGKEGLVTLAAETIDAIILDIGLPDINGFELCKEIRRSLGIPVIFLTARSDEIDRVVGLEIGADDYVVKPFSPRELTARVTVGERTVEMELGGCQGLDRQEAVLQDREAGEEVGDLVGPGEPEGRAAVRGKPRDVPAEESDPPLGRR